MDTRKRQTSIHRNEQNPVFDEQFKFPVSQDDLKEKTLILQVRCVYNRITMVRFYVILKSIFRSVIYLHPIICLHQLCFQPNTFCLVQVLSAQNIVFFCMYNYYISIYVVTAFQLIIEQKI